MAREPLTKRVWQNAGAPTSGASGTYANHEWLEKGDLLTDTTNGALYQNTNTQASPTWTLIGSGGVTLDGAYDYGGAGSGKAVTVDSGAIALTNNAANNNGILTLTKNPSGAQSGDALTITVGAQATGTAITIANTGSGNDITGSGSTWTISKAGAVTVTTLFSTAHSLLEGTAPAGTVCYIVRDNTGDVTVNSLVGKSVNMAVAGTDVITVAGALVTIAQAVSVTTGGLTVVAGGIDVTAGGIEVTAGGVTVVLGGITVTGDSIITGALEVTGALTIGGAWTVSATLTVDELILDTDGTAPAATNCYAVRDNTGDLTLNAITGKEIHLAINNVDVFDVGTSVEVISGGLTVTAGGLTVSASGAAITGNSTITGDLVVTGSLTFGGNWTVAATLTVDELILDTDGAQPAGTNCYAVRDNDGDLTVNAITGKQFIVAINNTDEYTFSATILDLCANALDNVGYLILNAASAPAASEVYLVNDNTGDLTLNVLTGKEVHIAVNGTDEYDFNATAFQIASANNIQFMGDNGILDSAGNEVILVTAVGSAANYLNVRNAAAANPIILECLGTADRGFEFHNDQSEQILILTPVASAVNEITILNAAAGGQPIIRVTGEADNGLEIQNLAGEIMLEVASSATPLNWITIRNDNTGLCPAIQTTGEADIGLEIQNAAGEIEFATVSTNAPTVYLQVSPNNTGLQPIIKVMGENDIGLEIQNAEGERELETVSVATPVNWLSVSNSATGNPVILLNPGEDDIGFSFQAKNAEPMLNLAAVAVAKDYIVITSAITTAAPTITVAGDTDNIDLSLAGKGTGYVRIDANLDMSDNTLFGSQASGGDLLLSSTVHGTKGAVSVLTGNEGFKVGGVAIRAGTAATNVLAVFNGDNPQAGQALANGIEIYSNAGECFIMDAAGTATQQTPHDKEGYYYLNSYSTKRGKTIRVHVERMLRAISDKFPGEFDKFIEELPGNELYQHA